MLVISETPWGTCFLWRTCSMIEAMHHLLQREMRCTLGQTRATPHHHEGKQAHTSERQDTVTRPRTSSMGGFVGFRCSRQSPFMAVVKATEQRKNQRTNGISLTECLNLYLPATDTNRVLSCLATASKI